MDGFVYVAYLIYIILSVLVVAFVAYILPSLCIEIWESLVKTEWVERLLLAVEEFREWHTEPGKHRVRLEYGIELDDEAYLKDLNRMWREVEDTLRVDLSKKAKANV